MWVEDEAPYVGHYGTLYNCYPDVSSDFQQFPLRLTDTDLWRAGDLVGVLIQMPAADFQRLNNVIGLGLTTGALVELLPLLCALDVSWGCPDDPAYPGVSRPAPAPGGDHR
jgi:hypothetical protein